MSIKVEESKVQVVVKKRVAAIKCELCPATGRGDDTWPDDDGGNASRVVVAADIGSVWPEGDFRTTKRLDICPDCFEERLVPWFRSCGGTVREYETEDGPVGQ
jgi:hypothetical protein